VKNVDHFLLNINALVVSRAPNNPMGVALFQIKLMPESPEINRVSLAEEAKETVEDLGATNITITEQPVAFGLVAVIIGLRINENVDSSKIEESLANVDGVSSVQIIDYRRAIN
jgi:elongation factor 1-beta